MAYQFWFKHYSTNYGRVRHTNCSLVPRPSPPRAKFIIVKINVLVFFANFLGEKAWGRGYTNCGLNTVLPIMVEYGTPILAYTYTILPIMVEFSLNLPAALQLAVFCSLGKTKRWKTVWHPNASSIELTASSLLCMQTCRSWATSSASVLRTLVTFRMTSVPSSSVEATFTLTVHPTSS